MNKFEIKRRAAELSELAEQRNPLRKHIVDANGNPLSFEIVFFYDEVLTKFKRIGFFAFTQQIQGRPNDELKDLMGLRTAAAVDADFEKWNDCNQMLDFLEVSIMKKIYDKIYSVEA
jgi:hypothetical protein